MTTTVTAIFHTSEEARVAVELLLEAGFGKHELSLVMSKTPHGEEIVREETADTARGAIAGAVVGGGFAALLAGLMAIPAIGAFAVGPLLVSLAAGGAGAATGGLLGVLVGHGTGEQAAADYMSHIRQGEVLIGVDTDRAHAVRAKHVMRDAGGVHIADSVHFSQHHRHLAEP